MVDSGNNRIQKFSNDGGYITKWGSVGSSDGKFNNPVGITVDLIGNVYVADKNNFRIQAFSQEQAPSMTMGGNMTGSIAPSMTMGANMTGSPSMTMGANMT